VYTFFHTPIPFPVIFPLPLVPSFLTGQDLFCSPIL
jgi:hypothetical protein